MMFCGNSIHSVKVLNSVLSEFSNMTGLFPNIQKRSIYIAGTDQIFKDAVKQELQFHLDELPVRYLGIPLLSTRLSEPSCKPLIDAILERLKGWTLRPISYAGRLQLINSVIVSLQVYWSSHIILPKKISNRIEQILRFFLWKGIDQRRGGAKVAWKEVAAPLKEGGLGIKRIREWNEAAMAKILWMLLQPDPTSTWAKWARANLIRGRSFWDIPIPGDCSWTWRQLL